MATSDLQQWLHWIESAQQTGRTRSWFHIVTIARRLDLLRLAPQTVVVGGTNGKGTTVYYMEQLLVARGVKVGSTYSPHLQRYNERIRINGREVSDDEITLAFEVIRDALGDAHLSYHDYATLASFLIFKRHQVEFVALEVGVGGRYDATNVVYRDANVITSVALDHQNMLGPDIESIGWEKAGISRCGVPLIYGDSNRVSTVTGRARALNCRLLVRGREFDFHVLEQNRCSVSIRGGMKAERRFLLPEVPGHPLSLTLAVQALVSLGHEMRTSDLSKAQTSRLSGRMELISYEDRHWLLDVAHNPVAIEYLMQTLPKITDNLVARVLLGTSKHKDFVGIIKALQIPTDRILVTATQGKRGTTWKTQCCDFGIQCIEELDLAYQELVAKTVSGDLILVVGSFDVVGRLRTKVAR